MRIIAAIAGGVIGGLIGAAIWTAIAYFVGLEVGYVAWAVGGLTGFGVALGNRGGEGGLAMGALAVCLAIVSIGIGRLGTSYLYSRDAFNAVDFGTAVIADEIIEERLAAGEPMPEMPDDEFAEQLSDLYPAAIWNDATVRWHQLTPAEQAEYEVGQGIAMALQTALGALFSFGMLDIVFFGLAIFTAFKLGSAPQLGEPESETLIMDGMSTQFDTLGRQDRDVA